MAKAILLFLFANEVPMWLLVSVLQFFIPLNMVMRTCCINGVAQHKVHWLAALLIFVGVIISFCTLGHGDEVSKMIL